VRRSSIAVPWSSAIRTVDSARDEVKLGTSLLRFRWSLEEWEFFCWLALPHQMELRKGLFSAAKARD